ncbi:MAG: molecular chaperone DnaJ, partial [Firmicutes bacterium]|nr:molecular chaperone DnaJ [Bacillota bacterium]
TNCQGSRSEPGSDMIVCEVCHGTGEMRSVHSTPFGQVVRSYTCSRCQGEGRIVKTPCSHCHGEGRIYKKRSIHVKIPAGVDTGSRIRIPGEGEAGIYGGPNGDLYIFIHVKPHELFEREESEILHEIHTTFTDAALGTEIEIPTLDGKTTLKIPAGTQNGTVFKLKGKGMPSLRTGKRGDQLVTVFVMIPTRLNEKQKQLLREFATAGSQEAEKSFFDKLKGTFKTFLP